MTFLEVFSRVCPRKIRVVLFLSLPTLSFIATWFSGEVPITITIDPSVVLVAIGNQPALVKDQQEESLCHYTCNSEGWYPRPQVTWTTYGGGKKNVEIKTNVTWSETDLFVVQSIMTVPCDDVDVKCVIMLIKEKINQTGSLNEMILQKPSTVHTCMYKSQIKGTCANPKAVLDIPQGEHLSSLTKTSILEEKYNIFAIENSVEICGQPPPSGLTTDRESYLHIVQQSENHNWLWILYLFCLIFVLEELQARGRSRVDAERGTLKKEIEELRAKYAPCEKQIAQCQKQLEEIQAQGGAGEDAEKEILEKGNEELRAKYEELQARGRSRVDAEIEELRAKSVILEKENEELRAMSGTLKNEIELLRVQRHKVDVTFDADTAHPRLQVSEDGKSVTDTGVIRKVPNKDERFDSHTFLLAKEGYRSGRHYWEVDVGKKRNWNLGVAQETVRRKETVALSPKNGFWVIGLADGQEYWALSDPWTCLMVSGRPQKIGIFLDVSSKKLSFFSVHQKKLLYTFTSVNHHSQNVKLFPFFSTGSAATSSDTEPLRIAGGFDDDDK